MGCSGCEGNVEFSLSQIQGVDEVRADRNTQEVEIFLNDEISMDAIQQEMSVLGYAIEAN
jgi:copper chaperone CopZ